MRNTWRHFDYHALCEDCGWEASGNNALGIAAQHHDRTNHTVGVEVTGHITYCGDAEDERRQARKAPDSGG